MKLKVCGMKNPDNINKIATLKPDFLGFIYYKKSPRAVTAQLPKTPKQIKKIGVFVDASVDQIVQTAKENTLWGVQLHGEETVAFCKSIKKTMPKLKIIKAFGVSNSFNFNIVEPYKAVVDFYLFDTKGKLPGGNGITFNWNLLENYTANKPYFLSGGIGLEHINELTKFKKLPAAKYCYAVDINSQFESIPGLKKLHLLKRFMHQLKNNL